MDGCDHPVDQIKIRAVRPLFSPSDLAPFLPPLHIFFLLRTPPSPLFDSRCRCPRSRHRTSPLVPTTLSSVSPPPPSHESNYLCSLLRLVG
ncbi:hypothetical protein Droror1_Dr00000146, partial [Drosera rotundifolia]